MYHTVYLDDRVAVSPAELAMIRSPENIKNILLDKLREKHEGRCNANGYIRPGSINLLARSMGVAENGRFTGNLMFDCKMKCEILYPVAGAVVEAQVLKVNKMGAYAVLDEAMRILLPRDLHLGDKEFDSLKEGQSISARIDRTRFQTNDFFIMAVGHLVSSVPVPSAAQAGAPELLTVVSNDSDEEKIIVLNAKQNSPAVEKDDDEEEPARQSAPARTETIETA